ncbi:MAG: HAD-IC family P-type ATPase, partial [Microcoleus sp.]
MSSNSPSSWHTVAIDQTLQQLSSNKDTGLSGQQVSERLQQYGPNELEETGGRSAWSIFIDQFTNIMLVMLMFVAVVSAFLDIKSNTFPKDAIAIFAIVVLNGILGYFQESKAEQALAALKNLSSPLVRVVRDGKTSEIAAKDVVPGDIMLLEAGVKIAADGRLIEASNLQVRESALTGEALAVTKQADIELEADASLGDRINLIFQGTEVVQGRAKAIVTNTGMQTELGKIATMLQSVETEPTPLQQRMTQLGNVLVTGALALVAVVVVGGMIRFTNGGIGFDTSRFEDLLEVSLSMAVAVVPEGLAAVVTVTLALGTRRMVKRNALIRKLPAVETLGSVTTICSDKTGTLTQNKMVVQLVSTGDCNIGIGGEGYAPIGDFTDRHTSTQINNLEEYPELESLLIACATCNDAILQHEQQEWKILGDPTEGALLSLAGKAGIYKEQQSRLLPRISEFPFSSERKRMSVICQLPPNSSNSAFPSEKGPQPSYLMLTKGSPELTLERCGGIIIGSEVASLTPEIRDRILVENNRMASVGLRVLGFAYKNWETLPPEGSEETSEQDMIWLGLVSMLDAPRPEVREAVVKCREGGIRVVMITGDHQLTAQAIACDLGIADRGDRVLTGQELEKLTQEELKQQV